MTIMFFYGSMISSEFSFAKTNNLSCHLTLLVLFACTKTLDRVTAATKTNGRVALVDFYAECVFWQLRCDH